MKLTKSRLQQIIREEALHELEARDVPEYAAEQAGLAKATDPAKLALIKKLLPYIAKSAAKPWRVHPVGLAADVAGNLAIPGMARSGLIPGASEDWEQSAQEVLTDPNDPRPTWEKLLDLSMGTQYAGGIDWGSEPGRGPLSSPDIVASHGGGAQRGPAETQADADDYYAAQAEADELYDLRDDGDVPPEDYYDEEEELAGQLKAPSPIAPAPQNPLDLTGPVYGPPRVLPKRPSEGVPYLGPVKVKRPDLAESTLTRWQKIIKS